MAAGLWRKSEFLHGPRHQPGHCHKKATHLLAHDGSVVQGFANGHIVVIGHLSEKDNLNSTKKKLSEDLSDTPSRRDDFSYSKSVS